jgi:hypothetical protein
MAFTIRRVEYFYVTVEDRPGEAYKLLSQLASLGINLLAFTGIPMGPAHTQLSLFPDDPLMMREVAKKARLVLEGPHPALLVQGDDELGALAGIHEKLYEANVNVYVSTGVADGRGGYSYLLFLRPEEYERAAAALEV